MLSLTSPVETPFHRWPAGLKLGLLAVSTLVLFFLSDPLAQGLAVIGVACLYLFGGMVFFIEGLRRLKPLVWLVALFLAWHVITGDLRQGAVIVLRVLALVALANLVTMTTRLDHMIALTLRGLAPLGRFGVPVGAIGLAIAMVIRFTPRMAALAGQFGDAWRARARSRPGWRVAVPVTLAALDDADQVAEALRARGGVPRR